MHTPLVSIITPSYNREEFIEGTIHSVIAQTYPNVEHIVVDGASSDNTVAILDRYAQKGTLRYLSEPDGGMYEAINKGLAMAKGDILCYLNTDDRYFPWTVETAVRHFEHNQATDLLYGDTMVLDLERNRKTINILPTFSSLWLRCGAIIPQPTVFFRKKFYTDVGDFQREVKYLADCEYWLRADQAGMRFAKIHEILAIECNHPGTIRQSLSAVVAAEKHFLLGRYAPSLCTNHFFRSMVGKLKYIEKEWLTARFALRNKWRGESNGQQWAAYMTNYSIKMDIVRYYLDKVLRTKSDIWQLEEIHG